jgi:hypothetical protein
MTIRRYEGGPHGHVRVPVRLRRAAVPEERLPQPVPRQGGGAARAPAGPARRLRDAVGAPHAQAHHVGGGRRRLRSGEDRQDGSRRARRPAARLVGPLLRQPGHSPPAGGDARRHRPREARPETRRADAGNDPAILGGPPPSLPAGHPPLAARGSQIRCSPSIGRGSRRTTLPRQGRKVPVRSVSAN